MILLIIGFGILFFAAWLWVRVVYATMKILNIRFVWSRKKVDEEYHRLAFKQEEEDFQRSLDKLLEEHEVTRIP